MSDERAWEAAQEGAELIAEGRLDEARRTLEALVTAEPDNEYGYFFLGSAHYELGNYDKALAAYVRALELAPEYLGAMVNAGHALRMLGRYDQAIRMGRQVLARDKKDADALFLLATSHYARGDAAAAEHYLVQFMDANPGPELLAEAQGMLQVLRGEALPEDSDEEPS